MAEIPFNLLTEYPTHADAIREIERLQNLVAELLPFMVSDVLQGLKIGPAPLDHNDDCDDCIWYESSRKWAKRISEGEFDDLDVVLTGWPL